MMFRIIVLLGCLTACSNTNSDSPKTAENKDVYSMNYDISDTIRTKSIDDVEDKQDGPVKITYPNGKIKAEGEFLNGKKHSLWKSYYENGSLWSSTYFTNGIPDGHSISYYKNGNVMFKGQYSG